MAKAAIRQINATKNRLERVIRLGDALYRAQHACPDYKSVEAWGQKHPSPSQRYRKRLEKALAPLDTKTSNTQPIAEGK